MRTRIARTQKRRHGVAAHLTLVGVVATALAVGLASGASWAYWVAGSTSGSNGASAAAAVNQGATPAVSPAGSNVTVSWAASTLTTGDAVSGYIVKRYDASTLVAQTILSSCTGTIASLSCTENSVPVGSWKYSVTPVFSSNWQGAESSKSSTVIVETTPPTNNITLSDITGGAYKSGSTIYYRGGAAGSFTLTNAVADAGSGPASSQTAALTGTTTGWSHAGSTVSSPAGGPYVSNPFSWTSGTSSSPSETVTGRDVSGNTAATALSFVNDASTPTGGTISYLNSYQTGKSVSVTFSGGSDTGSGLASRQLVRASAALTNGTCGSFGSYANIGPVNPSSPYVDTAVSNATCYSYAYLLTDNVGNQAVFGTASVAKVDYAGAVDATTGLLSYWRMGESAPSPISTDTFTDAAATLLTAHTGEVGASWTTFGGVTEQISSQNRARRNGTGYSLMYVSATSSSADYSVEADLYVESNLNGDIAGVVGRLDTATNSYYLARWERANRSWNLMKSTNGTLSYISSLTGVTALGVGDTYRLRLEMVGSTLRLYVNDVLKVSGTDATLTAAGKAGIMDGGIGGSANKTDTNGIHLDNFEVSSYPRAADSKGSNTGDYENGVALGSTGVLPHDANTAPTFDGNNDYMQVASGTFPTGAQVRSTEVWFKTSSSARQALFSYGTSSNNRQYGLWINAGGTAMTAWGWGTGGVNDRVFTMPAAVNDGAWHQVVETYNGTSITLYIDGVALTPQTATRNTQLDGYGFSIGAILDSADASYGAFFNGNIDEVSFYTTTLTQTTVTNHYQLGTAN